jgi:hypothetical protein
VADNLVPNVPQSLMPEMQQGFHDSGGHQPWEDFSIDNIEGGFPYSAVPPWIDEQVRLLRVIALFLALNALANLQHLTDFSPPFNGHEGIILHHNVNGYGWSNNYLQMPEGW